MSNLLISNGLKAERILPMPFDSFYISMLSEKYKGSGFIKMALKGLINGLKSNSKSRKDVNLASSLIYIIKKDKWADLSFFNLLTCITFVFHLGWSTAN